ncbi:MAG: amino acid ABC transporter substrate-binding protein [Methanomicrobiaceae archaeon]|nr:amino acid ABC transporter substrate-binding protein [Methanomicrobiaceae archaeon]
MNKRILSVLVIITAILAVGIAGCTGSESAHESGVQTADTTPAVKEQEGKDVLIVGIDGLYPPFSYIDQNTGEPTGFDVDSMRWIAEDQGFEIEFQAVAWDGIIPALQAGNIDLVYSGMTITEERAEKINFTIPYWTVNQAIVAKEDSTATVEELREGKLIIGTQSGCTAYIWADENLIETGIMPADNLKAYPDILKAVEDVVSGRVDVAMYDSTVMNDVIESKPVIKIGFIETNEQFGIAVRKDDVELLEKLNTGLGNLMDSENWDMLIEKYQMK